MRRRFDILVVGGGHAGCEAALAAARLGARVAMVTHRVDRIAQMSCNPAVGGVGKGHLVREIDALGGAMGQATDATGIQFRRLNTSRGPAVRSTRVQADSKLYKEAMRNRILQEPGITVLEDEVADLCVEKGCIAGVRARKLGELHARAVVITSGTFLNGLCHVGEHKFAGGRVGDSPALGLSDALRRLGLRLGRFKTGTTPRLAAESVRWEVLEEQKGDDPRPRFSVDGVANGLPQVSCYVAYTAAETHQIIRDNLERSPLFSGCIAGQGPRYCPSIEDKIVRFADKSRHQLFLEPEGLDSDRIYPAGLSTSLPADVQEAIVQSIPGLEQARILQHGYAVEYDYVPPEQVQASLMTKLVPGLFLAGQINGTSGYEEAAAQGLMAGLNATRFLAGDEPAVLGRDEAYVGVLIDDLTTQGVDEPYRVFTSRAEHRLTLRESNAETRLLERAREWGLLPPARVEAALARARQYQKLEQELVRRRVGRREIEALGQEISTSDNKLQGSSWQAALRRPEVTLRMLLGDEAASFDDLVLTNLEEDVKYAGYIERERREIERLRSMEGVRLPPELEFTRIPGLSSEMSERFARIQPTTLGQAQRIQGVTPAAISVLRVYLRRLSSASAESPVSRETSA